MTNPDLERLQLLGSKRMLVADDDAVLIRLFDLFLRPSGFEITTVSNGHELLTTALGNPPDVILTDVRMPMIGGLEVVRRLRQQLPVERRDLPILVVTAFADRDECLAAGATDFIEKPVSADQLYHFLATSLAGSA